MELDWVIMLSRLLGVLWISSLSIRESACVRGQVPHKKYYNMTDLHHAPSPTQEAPEYD